MLAGAGSGRLPGYLQKFDHTELASRGNLPYDWRSSRSLSVVDAILTHASALLIPAVRCESREVSWTKNDPSAKYLSLLLT